MTKRYDENPPNNVNEAPKVPSVLRRLDQAPASNFEVEQADSEAQFEVFLGEIQRLGTGLLSRLPDANQAYADNSLKQMLAVDAQYDEVEKRELEVGKQMKEAIETAVSLEEVLAVKQKLDALIDNNSGDPGKQQLIINESVIEPLLSNESLLPWRAKILRALRGTSFLNSHSHLIT